MVQKREIVISIPEGTDYTISEKEKGKIIICFSPKTREAVTNQSEEQQGDESRKAYFTKISEEERNNVKNWLENHQESTDKEKGFLEIVREAVRRIDYDYSIATIEPSIKDGKIYYEEGEEVAIGFSVKQWRAMAKEYSEERGSRLANLYELFLWYALRIANGFWTLNYVANNSASKGNYWNATKASRRLEVSGAKECGGYNDGQGNAYKIVDFEDSYAVVGGAYDVDGYYYPVANVNTNIYVFGIRHKSLGVVVLTK